jgi:hypothetical protein
VAISGSHDAGRTSVIPDGRGRASPDRERRYLAAAIGASLQAVFGKLFVDAHSGELSALRGQHDAGADDNESERGAQASWRDTVDAGADD